MQTAPKKVINGWAVYDWANSVYNLVITTTIFPAYYVGITKAGNGNGEHMVSFFGRQFINTSLLDYVLAVVFLLIAVSSPILSSIADYRQNKKVYLRFFCILGSLACCGLSFFTADSLEYGVILFALAAVGYWGSLVFYNSYLPDIAAPEDQDRISAKGYALGYIGSVLLQVICFVIIVKPEWFGFDPDDTSLWNVRISFVLAGLWWFGFAQLALRVLPIPSKKERREKKNVFTNGFKELGVVFRQLKDIPLLKRFLLAFFLYSMGVQTVMLVAAGFSKKEIFPRDEDEPKLLFTLILIQLVAIAGAMIMSRLSKRWGNINVLIGSIFVWIAICIWAFYVQTQFQFYLLASTVGLVMGGIQSMSRSTYSKFLPETKDTTSFFSFYDVTEKIALVIGLFSFGFLEDITDNIRNSVLALLVFFLLGLLALLYTKKAQKTVASF